MFTFVIVVIMLFVKSKAHIELCSLHYFCLFTGEDRMRKISEESKAKAKYGCDNLFCKHVFILWLDVPVS
jgi:hypothetical protein